MNYLNKTTESYNAHYNAYRAVWCRKSGLPMYSRSDFTQVERKGLYTKSRAARDKVEIDESKVLGWYRLPNGYTPLFGRK